MKVKQFISKSLLLPFLAVFFVFSAVLTTTPVYADPVNLTDPQTNAAQTSGQETDPDTCYNQVGGLGWLICSGSGVFAKAIDSIYSVISDILTVKPLTTDQSSPIYTVWSYLRDLTNLVFIIMLLIVVWSQLTGVGISNYGIKKTLPRIIVAALTVNLSFFICALAVDASNIIGTSLRGFLNNIQEIAVNNLSTEGISPVSWTELVTAITSGTAVAGIVIGLTGGLGHFIWVFLGALVGAIIAVFVGLVTIAMRQAVVYMLIMISPLAFVAYMLPNTHSYFQKWKKLFTSMLTFFPMFSLLFGSAQLAGWTLVVSALASDNSDISRIFGIMLGMTVQVLPLFLSVSLMRMSGTVLGKVSSQLGRLTARPNAAVRGWSISHAEQRRQNYLANSVMPAASLQRYLNNRHRLRDIDTKNSVGIRMAQAETYAQSVLRGNKNYYAGDDYETDEDGNVLRDNNGNPILKQNSRGGYKTNHYTRNAARHTANTMRMSNAVKDTQHVLGNYGTYHGRTAEDRSIANTIGREYIESARTEYTAINDNQADVDWLTTQYLDYAKKGHDSIEYRHFITAAGGGLGEAGAESVMAQVIAKAATLESGKRSRFNTLQNKFKYSKGEARSMYVGYKVNDDGIALDANGSELKFAIDESTGTYYISDNAAENKYTERSPGELLKKAPHLLVAYDKHDENGDAYFDMTDQDGKFVTRVYRKDSPVMKELLTNFDMPINDPINGLYGILAGHKAGSFADYTFTDANGDEHQVDLPDVGLANLSTTIGRGMLSARFKEKAAFAGPMYATSVSNRYIQDFCHQNIARLDNLIKTGKPGSFNVQDSAELKQLARLMDPNNWAELFPEDSLRSYRNVNGDRLKGTRADGSKVSADEATYEELMNTVIAKWLNPIAPKMASMMSRYTQNTADNQKPGTDAMWGKLYESLGHYNDEDMKDEYGLDDPFKPQEGFWDYSKQIRQQLHSNSTEQHFTDSTDLRNMVEDIRMQHNYDKDDYVAAVLQYLLNRSNTDVVARTVFNAIYTENETLGYEDIDSAHEAVLQAIASAEY